MNLEQIEAEAAEFFEWPNKDKKFVTTTSAILFARHCVGIATAGLATERGNK